MSDNTAPKGEFRLLRARDLHIIKALQRQPSADRLRKFDPWDDRKVGVILVAQITDGQHKGRLHPYDGATRVLYKQQTDPDYVFQCVVTPMTQQEAADAFLIFNQLSMKPSAFARYQVGIQAKRPESLAIQRALKRLGLEAAPGHSRYGSNGKPGVFVAFAAAERIVTNHHKRFGEGDDEHKVASDHFVWVLEMTRAAYPQHGDEGPADAHDADIIQAVSWLGLTYDVEGEVETQLLHAITTWKGKTTPLFTEGMLMRPAHWRQLLISQKGNTAGSESRGAQIGGLIATNYNRGFRPYLRRA